ncbi:LysE family transporter [Elizabethkingia argentiflava]|uniref:LysE family transporter n=1 Tax=Elizabethkingia argenteiflava TaxID=2681556 RepID=A0A845PYF0_9FLAO|nr:LysE/ArgO family amino acid transporter [Elizabethkingia argenteiflava]NAW51941.1 LysE family transporter [Elizabethkingia argenteiflava]
MRSLSILIKGFLVSAALIIAIGAQNAYVLKKGLKKENIFWVSFTCFLYDFVLIVLGVFGLGKIIGENFLISILLSLAGCLFLFWYGFNSFRSAIKGTSFLNIKTNEDHKKENVKKSILTTLAITLLNPHVYLGTIVVIGGVTNVLNNTEKIFFTCGALFTSFLWFFSLGYGAYFLIPFFKKKITWQILDFIIGLIMWSISFSLAYHAIDSFNHWK